ncbi:hypothetical protein CkaCkLH20_08009 [Colletotrichum karsti]|uniref:Uncharacterized protein n=1 Tax=Colletotrichum karsti TaxID=1095194 RepID=A0A9P6I5P7_9PEZI|nr:uncharacterized protein CkaCkLH20_08009 [Colletotrichum karsti]KAF9874446.1 hypothetical protein CkaCkLH20_08009 [Colletotrichum karsti]
MKSAILLAITPLLSLGTSAVVHKNRNPTPSSLKARDQEWSFSVYQSSVRCTGARDPYSGSGSQGCTKGIRNGSFGSYTSGDIAEGCSVYIYNNDNCDSEGIIDILTSADPSGCLQPQLEVSGSASFKAECD